MTSRRTVKSLDAHDVVVRQCPAVRPRLAGVKEAFPLGVLLGERQGPISVLGRKLALKSMTPPGQALAWTIHRGVGENCVTDVVLNGAPGLRGGTAPDTGRGPAASG
jgi:hypothetical protein